MEKSTFIFSIIILTLHSSMHCFENNINSMKKLFVFGDSLFDPGNNQYLVANPETDYVPGDRWPYGITFPGKPTGRISDGRLVPDFIGKTLYSLLFNFLVYSVLFGSAFWISTFSNKTIIII